MTVDPYSVLGVQRGATDKDIQRAFRKLAKQLHPDLNPGDKAAAERFKKVSQAYDILAIRKNAGNLMPAKLMHPASHAIPMPARVDTKATAGAGLPMI